MERLKYEDTMAVILKKDLEIRENLRNFEESEVRNKQTRMEIDDLQLAI